MKISWNWLRDYLALDGSPEKIGEILTDTGLEVEGIEKVQAVEGGLEGLVVGKVLTAEQHPNADRLRVTTVDVGADEPLNIVCGAPNVAAGQKVIVATVGTMLYPTKGDPFKIKKGKIRGEVSMGMICAEDEIGLGEEHDGIMVLPETSTVGHAVKEVLDIQEDYVIEIGLTPNRSDATSHIGVAKDLAAALKINHDYKESTKLPDISGFTVQNNDLPIVVEVRNTTACPRYTGVSIKGVKVGPSPEWMQERLKVIGVRPINNIVDITNYVLHETGQPLHAFDADKIAGGKVIVENLPEGSKFTTLDEVERELHPEDLMICDGEDKGMCIAGVFGGIHSGVTEETSDIFLESAVFDAIITRKTSTRHLLRTDAATRFEKGVDPAMTIYALKRAALLMQELAGGTIASEVIDIYPNPITRKEVEVKYSNINRLIGVTIPKEEVHAILEALEIEVLSSEGDDFRVAVGTNRADVYREADIIEEVLRIYGFNKVPIPSQLNASLSYRQKPENLAMQHKMANFLAAKGFNEMMGTSITNSAYYKEEEQEQLVWLLNSLNANLDVMRKNMLFSGLEVIKHNINHKNHHLRLFEFGKTYSYYTKEETKYYEEQQHLTLFFTGAQIKENWQREAQPFNFFDLKDAVTKVLSRLGINSYQVKDLATNTNGLAYGLTYSQGKKNTLASFGAVAPAVRKQFGIKQDVFYADINWDAILKLLRKKKVTYQAIPKYPSSRRDLALLLDRSVPFADVAKIATQVAKHILQSVNLFDIFEDENKIGKDKKSYAVSFTFQDPRKTLTDKEIDKTMKKLMHLYKEKIGAEIR